MKVIYDIEVDILRILFNDSPVEESDEEREGIIFLVSGSHAPAWEPSLDAPASSCVNLDAGASSLHSHASAWEREKISRNPIFF